MLVAWLTQFLIVLLLYPEWTKCELAYRKNDQVSLTNQWHDNRKKERIQLKNKSDLTVIINTICDLCLDLKLKRFSEKVKYRLGIQ